MMALIKSHRKELEITGFEVLMRPERDDGIRSFDGKTIPLPDASVDVVMFVDVLHHTEDQMVLLREAVRVARKAVVIKDHCRNGLLAKSTLRFMDWVGNAHHGVALPYNYWSRQEWKQAFKALGLEPVEMRTRLGLYPWPASWLFEHGLHFAACLGWFSPGREHAVSQDMFERMYDTGSW